jgi:serine protease Do
MNRRFALVIVPLIAGIAFLVGLIMAGSLTPGAAVLGARPGDQPRSVGTRRGTSALPPPAIVNFADVVTRVNAAVVNIDATSRGRQTARRALPFREPGQFDGREREVPRRGAGSGFIIDAAGFILTNNHVVEGAERLTVKLADGRNVPAHVIGTDPDTDVALIKIETPGLRAAPLGNSDRVRVGEWVCAIGNPLAYEHSVTVGVVSYVGRKLWDRSLDNYIQTDAAINFGNSGGPLINTSGEVIGINAAISSRASNIGFAVPINQAAEILDQLKKTGHVSRGYIGVRLKELDPDLVRSLRLGPGQGALVEDVTEGSPGERVGVRTYDLIQYVDDTPIDTNDDLIRAVAARQPGSQARLRLLRDGRQQTLVVKLAERPRREQSGVVPASGSGDGQPPGAVPIGLTVRELDRESRSRLAVPSRVEGVLVSQVEALSPAYDADIQRGFVVIEVNRRRTTSVAEYELITKPARPGDALTFYVFMPAFNERALRTIRVEGR